MAITRIDTSTMRDIADDITRIVNEYEVHITKLYARLAEVPTVTKEWTGNRANQYFRKALLDKTTYIAFGEKLKEYSKKIKKDAESIEAAIKSCSNIEGD
jgi:UDP-glucose 6-dehydrogenase